MQAPAARMGKKKNKQWSERERKKKEKVPE